MFATPLSVPASSPQRQTSTIAAFLFVVGASTLVACEDKPSAKAAPVSSTLASAAPASSAAVRFVVDAPGSKVTFLMDAPIEKIDGDAPGSLSGELFVDLEDLTRSTGLLKVDLDRLTLYQQKRDAADKPFGERKKSDIQNEHARNWLEIGAEVSAEVKAKHRYIELRVKKLETTGPKSLKALTGAERTVELTLTGDFRLHERTVEKTAKLAVTFVMAGDTVSSVKVKLLTPVPVNLEQHDVRPRDTLGKILQKTQEELATLGTKVSRDAMVSVEFSAAKQ